MGNSNLAKIPCRKCDGIGLVKTERGSVPCECQSDAKVQARLSRLILPDRLREITLESFISQVHTHYAYSLAENFVKEFIPGQTKTGLLFTGYVGTGKTHLAIGIARTLVETKGIEARFVDVRDLLDRLRGTYEENASETQGQVLRSIFSGELIVIDDLGAARPTDWISETLDLLLGKLYNMNLPTIVTTNYPAQAEKPGDYALSDRIGSRMWSRLQHMCRIVEIKGPDWRLRQGRG